MMEMISTTDRTKIQQIWDRFEYGQYGFFTITNKWEQQLRLIQVELIDSSSQMTKDQLQTIQGKKNVIQKSIQTLKTNYKHNFVQLNTIKGQQTQMSQVDMQIFQRKLYKIQQQTKKMADKMSGKLKQIHQILEHQFNEDDFQIINNVQEKLIDNRQNQYTYQDSSKVGFTNLGKVENLQELQQFTNRGILDSNFQINDSSNLQKNKLSKQQIYLSKVFKDKLLSKQTIKLNKRNSSLQEKIKWNDQIDKRVENIIKNKYRQNTYSDVCFFKRAFNVNLTTQEMKRLQHSNIKIDMSSFLQFNWRNVQLLMLHSCQIDDEKWRLLIQNSFNIQNLKVLYIYDNKIKTVNKNDLQKFQYLKQISFGYAQFINPLTNQSIRNLKQIQEEKQKLKLKINLGEIRQSKQN